MYFHSQGGQALVDLKGTSRQPPLSLPCLGETGVEVEDQPSAAVACRQLCLALPVFSCTLYESPSPEKILILRALSLSLSLSSLSIKISSVKGQIWSVPPLRKIQNCVHHELWPVISILPDSGSDSLLIYLKPPSPLSPQSC